AGLVFQIDIELAGLEGFEGDVVVAVELDLHAVDIVLAPVDRKIPSPVVPDPFEYQTAAGRHLADAVGAAVERRLEGGFAEGAIAPVMFRQHRQLAQTQDQQRVVCLLEDEAYAM